MDDFDRAQELEMASRNAAIAAQRTQGTVTYSHCVDCGEAIPPQRQALGGIRRCVDCQDYLEQQQKRGL